jgi:hypothetical protein
VGSDEALLVGIAFIICLNISIKMPHDWLRGATNREAFSLSHELIGLSIGAVLMIKTVNGLS